MNFDSLTGMVRFGEGAIRHCLDKSTNVCNWTRLRSCWDVWITVVLCLLAIGVLISMAKDRSR
jgi:hypothetical protein